MRALRRWWCRESRHPRSLDFSNIEMRLELSDYREEFMIEAPNVEAAASRVRTPPRGAKPAHAWASSLPHCHLSVPSLSGSRRSRISGVDTTILSFYGPEPVGGDRLWVDPSGLVRRAKMSGYGHFMYQNYSGLDAPITITSPSGQGGRRASDDLQLVASV